MPVISGKALGRRKPLFADFSVPPPPSSSDGGQTLRELIAHVVASEVAAFKSRQEERQLLRALTAREVAEGAERGKIQAGPSEMAPQPVDVNQAIGTALQAFEDGLYFVILDDVQQKSLDAEIFVRDDSRVTFVRLTLLAGG